MARKTLSCTSSLIFILLAVVSFLATYNSVTMVVEYKEVNDGGLSSSDPIVEMPDNMKRPKVGTKALFHVALTATDDPYSKWQCRIMYYWYKKTKAMAGSKMGKLTRILHSGESDNLMDEIPTFVVDPLPSGLDREYIVLNRPWAFVQWLERATIEEEYILMAEPDHIFVNPLPNLARGDVPAGYPFFYMKPEKNVNIIRKYYPKEYGPVTNVDPIGNSPVIIRKDILENIAPTWMNVSLRMKDDPETDKTFGWVLEMYAYAVASALHGVQHILRKDFMLQPPWDLETGKRFIIHYTYGCDYNNKGELTYGKIGEWRFDKRSHVQGPPPKNLSLPPLGVPQSVKGKIKAVHLVDVPGHSRLRPKLDEYLPRAAGIVFVVDAVEFLPNWRAASEYLYDILTKASVVKRKIPLLILCNKVDKVTAHTKEIIRKQIEKELDKLRTSRTAVSDADISNEFTLGVPGEAFSFSQCINKVTIAEASALTGEILPLEQFIRERVKP